jgi:hypothetical protein
MHHIFKSVHPPVFKDSNKDRDLHPLGNAGSLKPMKIDMFEKLAPFSFSN